MCDSAYLQEIINANVIRASDSMQAVRCSADAVWFNSNEISCKQRASKRNLVARINAFTCISRNSHASITVCTTFL